MSAPTGPAHFTVVSLHAHPDDEALLTSGTLARAVVEGHRVVLVVATDGELGLAARSEELGLTRLGEIQESALALGVHRVVALHHPDSGWTEANTSGRTVFSELDVDPLAEQVAAILREESADVLTSYDANGGYGHPDHVQVHRVGARAAELAGTPVVLEATVDATLVRRAIRLLRLLPGRLRPTLPDPERIYTPRAEITHRVDVRGTLDAKRAAMRAHASQRSGGVRTLGLLLALPRPLARLAIGREYFREVGREPGRPPRDDIFASLR